MLKNPGELTLLLKCSLVKKSALMIKLNFHWIKVVGTVEMEIFKLQSAEKDYLGSGTRVSDE